MKVVPQVIRLGDPPAPIVHPKERYLSLLDVGFGKVSDNANPIFVVR